MRKLLLVILLGITSLIYAQEYSAPLKNVVIRRECNWVCINGNFYVTSIPNSRFIKTYITEDSLKNYIKDNYEDYIDYKRHSGPFTVAIKAKKDKGVSVFVYNLYDELLYSHYYNKEFLYVYENGKDIEVKSKDTIPSMYIHYYKENYYFGCNINE